MTSKSGEKVKSTNQTQNQFSGKYKKGFFVLPDKKTIVGVSDNNVKTLFTEDITTNKVTLFGKHRQSIYTLLYDKVTESLFGGDCSGHVKQYKRSSSNNLFSLVKDYGDVGVYRVICSAQVGRFALFVGRNYSIILIDILERRLFKNIRRSPFSLTFSLQVCHGLNDRMYLCLGGYNPNYSSTVSYFLDVTDMYNYKKQFTVVNEKKIHSFKHSKKIKKRKIEDLL